MAYLAEIVFSGVVIEWRGPSPFYFVAVPEEDVPALREAARLASYGWGVVPVEAMVDAVDFTTSLFPKDGGYLLPLKGRVRRSAEIVPGDRVAVVVRVVDRGTTP